MDLNRLAPQDYALPPALLERLLSPALIIYMDKVKANIQQLLKTAGPDRLRPHIKTAKLELVFRALIDAGIRRFKCATTKEASVLLPALAELPPKEGADLLVAYPHVGPALMRLAQLAKAHPSVRVSVLCESAEVLPRIPEQLGVVVDINPGMNRTGVPLAQPQTITALCQLAGARLKGLHFYEGHICTGSTEERQAQCFALYDQLVALHENLYAQGLKIGELITSGTPGFSHALAHRGLATLRETEHRVSPGTVVYFDQRSSELEELNFVPAALVLSRVVSHPQKDMLTCDAGSKALAAEAGDPCAVVLGHPELRALRPSEEHLPMQGASQAPLPERGAPLLLIPRHVCPTVNLAEEAIVIAGSQWASAPVSARAHELIFANEQP